jgi:hypothetical protein
MRWLQTSCPMDSSLDSLKPRPTAYQMPPGTTYSMLGTRKSYSVDRFGMDVEIGSGQAYASRFGTNPAGQSLNNWNNPLKQALGKLGG